jgi:capsular polysaccharide biosynthesis protein
MLEAILQKTVEELKLGKSFKTLVKVSELETQQQSDKAVLISVEEENLKEINKLHNILEGDLKKGMDEINKKRDTVAWLKVRIINAVFLQVHA